MRKLVLDNFGTSVNLEQINSRTAIKDFGNWQSEYAHLRNNVAFSDFSFLEKYVFDENKGIDFLDEILASNMLKLRYGRIADTFLTDETGDIKAEVFVANIDDKIIALVESLDDSAKNIFENSNADCENISDSYALLSVDGPDAWKVAEYIFGSDIFNLSFLSVEKYNFEGETAYLLRNGKTGEFGYQFLIPTSKSLELATKIKEKVESLGGGLCGFDAHQFARLEGNFFNIYKEGENVKDTLELGLQWMIDFSKPSFNGSEAIFSKRKASVKNQIVCITSAQKFEENQSVTFDGQAIGKIVSAFEYDGKFIGIANLQKEFSMPSLECKTSAGANLKTVSRPTILAKSLERGMQ